MQLWNDLACIIKESIPVKPSVFLGNITQLGHKSKFMGSIAIFHDTV
jgi:hypothetical protein